jgi:hypothetical protein
LLKRALQSEVLDIGRAKLLADAPVSALPDLIPVAASCSRADLSRRVASLRGMAAPPEAEYREAGGSRRLLKALQILESVSSVTAAERAIIERLRTRVVDLLDT